MIRRCEYAKISIMTRTCLQVGTAGSARWGAAAKLSIPYCGSLSGIPPQHKGERKPEVVLSYVRYALYVRKNSADYMATLSLVLAVSGIYCY